MPFLFLKSSSLSKIALQFAKIFYMTDVRVSIFESETKE